MEYPNVASRTEWLAARKHLLEKEKLLTRLRDEVSGERRDLPMVLLDQNYTFAGSDGPATLLDLFGPHPQLVIYHFMFDPAWNEGCKSCSFLIDNLTGALLHLAAANTAFAAVSKAPIGKLEAFRKRMGWNIPWYSSFDNTFNEDFQASVDAESETSYYNFQPAAKLFQDGKIWAKRGEFPGLSVFVRQEDTIFHTYSTYQRGLEILLNTFNLLDQTPLGRQEDGKPPMHWVRHHDKYESSVLATLA